ncbi:hypothetical protein [Thermomonospora cellulosilytica]|uniref:Uncharacterized protein n=1 Tax=Thermomonospora cellulosilytica TaxID=1411118 RepID=A0A7W3N4C8_9ACTN|nr:hypothetical protein [Thermomonospora cellulosilytica]MBA9007272.1 hypothetical protein [Thermomonospora cellulosilytica]
MDGVGGSHYLRYWHPTSREENGCEVCSVADVAEKVRQAEEAYRQAWVDYLPGVSIWREADVPEDSLSLGAAPDGWAIVHTDSEFLQMATRSGSEPDGVLRRVQFDDFLEIPNVCFIDKNLAVEVIALWMTSGELMDEVGFSDDLFSY